MLVADSSCAGLLGAIPVDERWVYRKGGGLRGLPAGDPTRGWGAVCWRSGLIGLWTSRETTAPPISRAFSSRRRVTFQRFKKKPFRKYLYTDFVDSSVSERHTADHYIDLLRPLGILRENVSLDLQLRAEDLRRLARFLQSAGLGATTSWSMPARRARKNIGCPNAGRRSWIFPRRIWSYERPDRVIGPRRAGAPLANQIASSLQAVDLSGRTNLLALAAVIKGAQLLCGVDTAAIHLADAMQTPSLALFGPTNPYHWRPRHSRSVILRARTRPPFTPQQKGGPMDEIPVASVIEG